MKALFLVSILLAAQAAWGQEAELQSDSNEALRSNKSYSVTLGIGVRTSDLNEFGLGLSYFLSPQSLVTLTFTDLDGSIKEKADGQIDGQNVYFVGVTTEVEGSAFALSYKQFFSDTFYLEGGLDYAKASGKFKISKEIFASTTDATTDVGHYTKLSAMIQIGNQWQWQNFTLGTSWLGMLLPLAWTEEYTDADFLGTTPNSAKKFEKASAETQYTALRFYLGWSF
jgi:hypothetical protein